MLKVENLTSYYSNIKILKNLSFDLNSRTQPDWEVSGRILGGLARVWEASGRGPGGALCPGGV